MDLLFAFFQAWEMHGAWMEGERFIHRKLDSEKGGLRRIAIVIISRRLQTYRMIFKS